jgi:hypothetical protein
VPGAGTLDTGVLIAHCPGRHVTVTSLVEYMVY